MFFVGSKVKDAFDKMLGEHDRVSFQKEVNQAELSEPGRQKKREGDVHAQRRRPAAIHHREHLLGNIWVGVHQDTDEAEE